MSGSTDMQPSTNAHRSSAASWNLANAPDSSSALSKNGSGIALHIMFASLEYRTSNKDGVELFVQGRNRDGSYSYLRLQGYISSRYLIFTVK